MTATAQAEPRRRPLYILTELTEKGGRAIRNRAGIIDGIPKDDPRRIAARELLMEELETLALIVETRRANDIEKDRLAGDRRQAEKAEREERSRRAFSTAGTNPLKAFPATGIGEIAARDSFGNIIRVQPSHIKAALAGNVPVLAMNEGFVVVSVPEAYAAALVKRYEFADTMEWRSGDRHCWAFSDSTYLRLGLQAGSIEGEKIQVASVRYGGAARLVFAPIEKLEWIRAPKQVKLTDDGTIPPTPEKLTRILSAVHRAQPFAIDAAVLD